MQMVNMQLSGDETFEQRPEGGEGMKSWYKGPKAVPAQLVPVGENCPFGCGQLSELGGESEISEVSAYCGEASSGF